jgi:mono/diheme cytochrome c family protein
LRIVIALTLLLSATAWQAYAAGTAPAGKAVYDKKCTTCHGANGEGNPKLAQMLKAEIRDLGSAEVQGKPDGELKKIIVEGTGKMKPVKELSGTDVDAVIAFIRSLAKQ